MVFHGHVMVDHGSQLGCEPNPDYDQHETLQPGFHGRERNQGLKTEPMPRVSHTSHDCAHHTFGTDPSQCQSSEPPDTSSRTQVTEDHRSQGVVKPALGVIDRPPLSEVDETSAAVSASFFGKHDLSLEACGDHGVPHDPCGAWRASPEVPWGSGSNQVDSGTIASSTQRARGRRDLGAKEQGTQPIEDSRSGHQQGFSSEGNPPGVPDGQHGHDPDGHRDHCSAQGEGPEPGLCDGSSSSHGLRRVRQALRQEVRGDLDGTAQLCSLGDADLQGGPREQHEASSLGQVAGGDDGAGASDGSHSRAFQEPEEGLPSQEEGRREVQFILRDDGNGFSLEGAHQGGGRHEGGSGDAPEATLGRHLKRLGENLPDASGSVDGSKGFFSEGLETLLPAPQVVLSERETKLLSLQAMEELPAAFGELIRYERPLLFEVACGPDSLLTDTMRKMTGRESAAERLSFWNGYDLATSTGVRKAINKIKKDRPLHVWISTECGPFSRMQRVNQRSPEQMENLKQKRDNCIRQYVGGLLIMTHCIQHGVSVSWEWSETCDAWRLPMVQNMMNRYQLKTCVVKGCRVGLRVSPKSDLMGKGWKIASTHEGLLQSMELPCLCGVKHAWCEGKLARESAYYTNDFAKRVCRTIWRDTERDNLVTELRGQIDIPSSRSGRPVCCTCDTITHPKSSLSCNHCEMLEESQHPFSMAAEDDPMTGLAPLNTEERNRYLRQIAGLHRNSGHSPVEHLVKALQARGSDPRLLELARSYQCPTCQEAKRMVPRPQVSLEPLPPKWKVVQADNAFWNHPTDGKKYQFTLMIDEGCRFRVGRVVETGRGKGINGQDLINVFQELWKPVFGLPDRLRVDPAGAWRSGQVADYMSSQNIELDTIPAEAHWQISHVERAIKCTKHIMTKLAMEDPEITAQEALAEALRTENEREIVRGYSPAQHALGRSPDSAGRFHPSGMKEIPPGLCENSEGEFQRNIHRMTTAEHAMTEWIADERLRRAANTRSYKLEQYQPGDLVYVWRIQTRGPASSARTGGFTGPARVLALETKLNEDNTYRPGSVVWLTRGSRLIKACPQQLRRASVREEALELLTNPPDLPWTFTKLTEDLSKHYYEDVTGDVPELPEFERAVDEETIRPYKRIRHKAYVPECPPPTRPSVDEDDDMLFVHEQGLVVDMDTTPLTEHAMSAEVFWAQSEAAVEIVFETPETNRGKQYMTNSIESFLVSNLRRRSVEVNEKHLTDEERILMTNAKQEEVKKYIGAQALEALPPHLRPHPSKVMRMRWILVWKRDDQGNKKAKARCVILGYMDPKYAERQTAAPTMSRTTRQLLLVISSALGFRVAKGDVSGAFLQGREYQGESYVIPTDEICIGMGLSLGATTRLKKACYGLVDAPLEWYLTVSDFLISIGFSRCVTDPCCFKYVSQDGRLVGLISGHVDDFLFCGRESDQTWTNLCDQIRKKFDWGTWEWDNFTQCGVQIKKRPEGGYEMNQSITIP